MREFRAGRKSDGYLVSVMDTHETGDVQREIGLRLRAVYEAIVAEPVPQRFVLLLESLDCSNPRKL